MKIRYRPDQDPIEVSLKEFIRLTQEGRILPDTLFRRSFLHLTTNGGADNFYLFHDHSPRKYPYGKHLEEIRPARNPAQKT